MATNDTALPISRDAQKLVLRYAEGIFANLQYNQEYRRKLLEADLLYAREQDKTKETQRARTANSLGDTSKMRNPTIPVVGPQVDSLRAYLTEMFLSSYPIFPVVTPPQFADIGLQIETILGQSSQFYQWGRHFSMCFLDGAKYNIMGMEVDWRTDKYSAVVNDRANLTQAATREEEFSGNALYRLDPYNMFWDRRVPPAENHRRGEFGGYCKLITRIELKKMLLDLDRSLTMNATEAFESGTAATTDTNSGTATYYVPQVNVGFFETNSNIGGTQNWLQWANLDTQSKIRYSDMYELTVLYCRVIPQELKIFKRAGNTTPGMPQIYKFMIINRKVVVFAQRLTNAHDMLPIIIGQLNEDGLGLQTKSYAENAAPYQQLASALYSSAIESQRKKVYDRLFYDPSRINKGDIDRVDPVARIPVKQSAYGKPLSDAVWSQQYRDDGVSNVLAIARDVVDMADVATGSNRVQRGQFQKGNKTRYEFDTVMQNSDSRPRTSAILLEISWLQPIKEILKTNILQFQPPAELFNPTKQSSVKVSPADIRRITWEFQLADGLMPSDKFLNFELFGQMINFVGAVPAAGAEYDLMGMFVYQLQMQGARWINQFKRDEASKAAYIQQLQATGANGSPPALPSPTGLPK